MKPEQSHATKKFNSLKSAESFKIKTGSNCNITIDKNGKFGVRFKIDKTKKKKKNL